jgi:hypothetical protein
MSIPPMNTGIPLGLLQALQQQPQQPQPQPQPVPAPVPGGPPQQSPEGGIDARTKMILSQIMQSRKQLAPAEPMANPSDLQRNPMMPGPTPPGHGVESFMYNLGASVHNAVVSHKEEQIRRAMADYSAIGNAWERAQEFSSGDPQKAQQMFERDPITQAILGDPKKMKNIAKALSVDWLNPEKTTVYSQALQRHMEVDKAGKMVKVLRQLHLAKQQQMQLSAQQRQQLVHEEAGKLPFVPQGTDPKLIMEMLTNERLIQQQKNLQQHWQQQEQMAGKQLESTEKLKEADIALRGDIAKGQKQLHEDMIARQEKADQEKARHDRVMEKISSMKGTDADKSKVFTEYTKGMAMITPYMQIKDISDKAKEYVDNPSGPGDIALLSAFIAGTKPEKGFRWTTTEVNMITSSRGIIQGAEARVQAGYTGVLFSPQQRKIIGKVVEKAGNYANQRIGGIKSSLSAINPQLGPLLEQSSGGTGELTGTPDKSKSMTADTAPVGTRGMSNGKPVVKTAKGWVLVNP